MMVTEPTETSVAEAFAHTAVLAGRPANQQALREVGQLFGRVAHLLDAVEDYRDDQAHGKWNPLAVTETPISDVRTMCDDAVLGIKLALADVEFTDRRLVHRLLTHELQRSVTRTFSDAGFETPEAADGTPSVDELEFGTGSDEETQNKKKAGWFDGCCAIECGDCCCDGCDCCECDDCCCDCGDCCDC